MRRREYGIEASVMPRVSRPLRRADRARRPPAGRRIAGRRLPSVEVKRNSEIISWDVRKVGCNSILKRNYFPIAGARDYTAPTR